MKRGRGKGGRIAKGRACRETRLRDGERESDTAGKGDEKYRNRLAAETGKENRRGERDRGERLCRAAGERTQRGSGTGRLREISRGRVRGMPNGRETEQKSCAAVQIIDSSGEGSEDEGSTAKTKISGEARGRRNSVAARGAPAGL